MEDALVQQVQKLLKNLQLSLNPCFNGRCTRTISGQATQKYLSAVLILVLMEDALVRIKKSSGRRSKKPVLILVLMEDALVLSIRWLLPIGVLNVLILVLMEDALVLFGYAAIPVAIVWVLILVLMEDALVQRVFWTSLPKSKVLILVLMEDALVLNKSLDPGLR